MTRQALHTAIAVALFATLAVAGCKNKTDAAMTPAPASVPAAPAPMEPAAAPSPMMVTTVDLGNAVGNDNRVNAPMTTFATNDTIHASVGTAGGAAGTLTAKWTYEDGQVVDSSDKSVGAGSQITDFSISKPDGWPVGKYKLEVMMDGAAVQSREFEVR